MSTLSIKRYVAIGDSLTEGIWDWGQGDRRAGFAYLLFERLQQRFPDVQFNNLGVGGARTADVVHNQLDRALQLKPDLLTLVVGANDVPGTPTPQFRSNFSTLIERLRSGIDGIIAISNLPNFAHLLPTQYASYRSALISRVSEFNLIIEEIARTHSIPVIDLHSNPGSADRRNLSSDGVHPNPRGYRLMADEFIAVLDREYDLGLGTDNSERSVGADI